MSEARASPQCIGCGSLTTLASAIAPLGGAAGQNIYRCAHCGKLAWIKVPASAPRPSA